MNKHSQEVAFQAVKDKTYQTSVLALYDTKALTKVSADTSSRCCSSAETLKKGGPVAFASCSVSEVEQRYAQIEKEALGLQRNLLTTMDIEIVKMK